MNHCSLKSLSCRSELTSAPRSSSNKLQHKSLVSVWSLTDKRNIVQERKWAVLSKVWLTAAFINTSVQPHWGIYLILADISRSNLFFLQDYLLLTFKRSCRHWRRLLWKRIKPQITVNTKEQQLLTVRSHLWDEGAERRWITELEVLHVDWSTSVCVLVSEQFVQLLLTVRKPPSHLRQEELKLRPAGPKGPAGFIQGHLETCFRENTWWWRSLVSAQVHLYKYKCYKWTKY